MTIIKTKNSNKVFKRIHDGFIFGNKIHLGIDFSTGVQREDLPEYYEEIENPESITLNILNEKLIGNYRLIDVTDLYNETININLFDNLNLTTFIINRPYIDGTWTDEDVVFYVNQLNNK
jgi:hypothetical protein